MTHPVELIVAGFDREDRAAEVLKALKTLKKEKIIGIWNAAVIVKDERGKLSLKETAQEKGFKRATGIGAVAGGLLGILAGGPIGGIVLGAAAGALAGKTIDLGFDDRQLKELGELLPPSTSAIVALIEHKWVGELLDALEAYGAAILRQAIADEVAAAIAVGEGFDKTLDVEAEAVPSDAPAPDVPVRESSPKEIASPEENRP